MVFDETLLDAEPPRARPERVTVMSFFGALRLRQRHPTSIPGSNAACWATMIA